MEHTASEDSKLATQFAPNCEPARLVESPECRPDNGADPDFAADTLSVESKEELDQQLDKESDEESDEETDEQSEERRARLLALSAVELRERDAAGVLSARGAKLAFTLPRELVDHIVDLFDGFYYDKYRYRTRESTKDLGSWSLVCLDWARRCRGLLHEEVEIRCRESALCFRALVKGPCSDRLTPLLDLIGRLSVETDPNTDAWSWLHLLTTIAPAVPANKFGRLWINGNPEVKLRFGSSIHWGVPAAVSALPAPYRKLRLWSLHFASSQSILRLIRSLPRVEELYFFSLTWDEDETRAQVQNVTPGRQPCSTLTHADFIGCQDATPLLLYILSPGLTLLQAIPSAEQRVIIQLVEGFNAVITAEGHGMFRYCNFDPSAHTSSETGITTGCLSLDTGNHCAYLSFHYRQPIIGCTVLISRDRDESNGSLNAFASHHLWRSLARLPNLCYLIVGLSDVDAVKVLAEKHQELWESLGKHLHYHHFASQPNAGQHKVWVEHNPVSLEQTDEKWNNNEHAGWSFTDKM